MMADRHLADPVRGKALTSTMVLHHRQRSDETTYASTIPSTPRRMAPMPAPQVPETLDWREIFSPTRLNIVRCPSATSDAESCRCLMTATPAAIRSVPVMNTGQ